MPQDQSTDPRDLVAGYVELLSRTPGVTAVHLAGSFARGTPDQWSDIDLLAGCDDSSTPLVVADVILAALPPPLLLARRGSDHYCLLNLVLAPWIRVDISVTDDPHPGGPRSRLRQVYGAADAASAAPSPEIEEFDRAGAAMIIERIVRLYGLLPTAIGRGELITSRSGSHLVWEALVELCLLAAPETRRMGALSRAQRISAEHRSILESLPAHENSEPSIIEFHRAAWVALLQIMISEPYTGVPWPPGRTLEQLRDWVAPNLGLELELPAGPGSPGSG